MKLSEYLGRREVPDSAPDAFDGFKVGLYHSDETPRMTGRRAGAYIAASHTPEFPDIEFVEPDVVTFREATPTEIIFDVTLYRIKGKEFDSVAIASSDGTVLFTCNLGRSIIPNGGDITIQELGIKFKYNRSI